VGDYAIVDLFAGPGGLDVAAHSLDIPVIGIELDSDACATRRAFADSHDEDAPAMETEQGDVSKSHPCKYPANVLVAGPPCQTFSVAGTGTGRRNLDQVRRYIHRMADGDDVTEELENLEDARTGLVLEPLRWVLARQHESPFEVIILEQVPAVLPVWQEMSEVFRALNYQAEAKILHAEEYGVPQTRKRAILIARRSGEVKFPPHTHQRFRRGQSPISQSDYPKGVHPWRSMGQALPERGDFTVVSNYGTGGDPKNRGQRTHLEPAFTVTGKIGRNRLVGSDGRELSRFTPAEAGVLQTFPRSYPWRGKDVHQQIGNAIPPLLAAHVLTAALGLPEKPVGDVLGYDDL
jgi:DNA (cytosine-5)-methyltransferase 1